jgi:hypothetical protein
MAVSKRESRNIYVEGHDFKWRSSGNDGWIVLWLVNNEDYRVVANIGYNHDMKQLSEDYYASKSQLVVTNRIIRELILHVGIEKILGKHGQINIGRIEGFYNVSNTLRS